MWCDIDSPANGFTFTLLDTLPAGQGNIVILPDGTYTYSFTPSPNFNGIVPVNYQVCDASGACDTATLTITVTPVNDAPVAVNDPITTNEDTPVSSTVAVNDSDIENDILTFTAITSVPVGQGTFVMNSDGTYTFTPAPNFSGIVTVNYKTCDSSACDTAVLTITINAANDAPIASNDPITTNEDMPVTGTVATNDVDTEGDVLTYGSITSVPANQGTFVMNMDGTFTFTPATDFNGVVSINYAVCDPSGACDTAVLTITVNAVNDAPVASNDPITTNEDTPATGTVATNDVDTEGDVLTYGSLTNVPSNQGTFVMNVDGTFTFTPATDFNGILSINYRVCDSSGACDTAVLTITVNAVNDAPVATNDPITTNEDTPATGTVATNDVDTEGDVLTYGSITNVPANQGTFVMNVDGTYTFVPSIGFNGTLNVNYTVCDPSGACDTAILTITVIITNHAPIANNDFNNTLENTEVVGNVVTNDSDPDENTAGTILTVSATTSVTNNGGIVLKSDGSYIYTPNAGFIGTDTIVYKVCDNGVPSKCDTALLVIEVRKKYITNDQKPVLNDDNVVANNDKPIIINVAANDFDPTGKTLGNPTIISNPIGGVVSVNADGTITFTPDSSFVGDAVFQYTICNNATPPACDTATVKISITKPVLENVRPIAVDDAKSNFKNNSISGTVAANDYDLNSGQTLSYGIVSNPINGSVVLNANGTFIYKPDSNYVGPDRFTYQVCDNGMPSKCDTATVYITIFDVPVTTAATIENTLFEELIDTVCLDTKELLGKNYTVTNVCASANSNASYELLAGTTCVKITALLQGEAKACMVVCDEFGVCDTTYFITNVLKRDQVTRVNAKNDEVGTLQGQPVISNVVKNDSLSIFGLKGVTIVTQGRHGTADIDSSNAIVFTPEADFCGYDYVTYSICNAYGCDTAVVKIRVICNGIKVYNAFSPNGDGVNDYFVIEGLDKFPNNKLEVYNRWGNAVLITKDYKSDWGGTWSDKALPDGTYFYVIDDGEKHYYSGYIQIYRGH